MGRILKLRGSPNRAARQEGDTTSEGSCQGSSNQNPAIPFQDHCTPDGEDDGWACGPDGRCELFADMDPSQIQVVQVTPEDRVFQAVQRRPGGQADHILRWCEKKDVGVFVSACPALPGQANIDGGLSARYFNMLQAACARESGRFQALGYTSITAQSDGTQEFRWFILPPVLQDLKIDLR
ncbi:hypothetical protein ISF_02296 [Cordyceps fumosorosea ARSEF 2679]|uniref:Uncharacterized protein n=1 Tax=Cordyceps fumosorosea (strain ARSEF 2679) TaxID=1081104 RepID=A0A162JKI6_CORFA|nr:hypothetical protein ISF_02296 [Cordyceps fumosorosea ARSEF 2679]OAA70322.1 hypothetical protein ISF_02296 [Cordyceps fumosorosea ARSEF 2679]